MDARSELGAKTSTCGRCYDEVAHVYRSGCAEDPEKLLGRPFGQYHCPDCGAMVAAGLPHPKLCVLCVHRQHPSFDRDIR